MQQLVEFLKSPEGIDVLKSILLEHLHVEIDTTSHWSFSESSKYLKIQVKFDAEVISTSSCSIS